MTSAARRSIEQKLERFVVDELLEEGYDGRDPLATAAIDSLGLEQLAEYVEQEFGLRLGDEEMIKENFESIPVLAAFIDSRSKSVAT